MLGFCVVFNLQYKSNAKVNPYFVSTRLAKPNLYLFITLLKLEILKLYILICNTCKDIKTRGKAG